MATPNEDDACSSPIYVHQQHYQVGSISQPASSLSLEEFRGIEKSVLGIPHVPTANLKVTKDEVKMLCLMLNHVTISSTIYPNVFLHSQVALSLAFTLTDHSVTQITLNDAVDIIEKKCTAFHLLCCDCEAHKFIDNFKEEKSNGVQHTQETKDLVNVLAVLKTLDVRDKLKDQSGGQCVSALIIKKQGYDLLDCNLKGVFLEVSCMVYNKDTGEVKIINARPDFIIQANDPVQVVGVGEVESSPFVQMLTAGLGHLSSPLMKYLMGICVGKDRSVSLYLLTNKLGIEIVSSHNSEQMFVGGIEVRPLSLDNYSLIVEQKLECLLLKIASVIQFIIQDYQGRLKQFEWINEQSLPVSCVLRRSERKRSSSSFK